MLSDNMSFLIETELAVLGQVSVSIAKGSL